MSLLGLNKNKGMSILETLIYTAILAMVMFMIFKSVTSTIVLHRSVKVSQTLESSGIVSIERILREIRNGTNVDIAGSSFGVSPGVLKISGTDSDGDPYNVTFDVSNGVIRIKNNDLNPEPLTASLVNVDSLIFRHISNGNSEAIRVEASFSAGIASSTKELDLYGFAILRSSY